MVQCLEVHIVYSLLTETEPVSLSAMRAVQWPKLYAWQVEKEMGNATY